MFVLPGIEGRSFANRNIVRGLTDGGVDSAIRIYDWTTGTGPFGWFVHLADIRRNRIQAIRLARMIIRYQKKHPHRPVFLIGHSGGAGIVLMTLDLLRKSQPVDGVILLGAAVWPHRNLVRSLKRTRRGIWNFYTPRDFGFLGLGTSLLGTIDRKFGPGAGAIGFRVPQGLSEEALDLYSGKLIQVRYDASMWAEGNPGTHAGWTNRRFVAKRLAPIVSGRAPSPGNGS
ncbi:MAG: alpha/beta hydrolase [Phycisphaerae bacterium]